MASEASLLLLLLGSYVPTATCPFSLEGYRCHRLYVGPNSDAIVAGPIPAGHSSVDLVSHLFFDISQRLGAARVDLPSSQAGRAGTEGVQPCSAVESQPSFSPGGIVAHHLAAGVLGIIAGIFHLSCRPSFALYTVRRNGNITVPSSQAGRCGTEVLLMLRRLCTFQDWSPWHLLGVRHG